MKYRGTYSCGHEGIVDITGPSRYRTWIWENEFRGLCPECQKVKNAEDLQIKIAEEADRGWPALEGTEKQIAWARKIRRNFYDYFEHEVLQYRRPEMHLACLNQMIQVKTSASYWIDTRNDALVVTFKRYIDEWMNERHRKEVEKEEADDETARAAKAEAMLSPENPESNEYAVLKVTRTNTDKQRGTISCSYPRKDDAFRGVMKSLRFTWRESYWELRIGEMRGPLTDRAAEVACRLLAAGFRVEVYDNEVREMAITQNYAPEHRYWVAGNENELRLIYPYDEKLSKLTYRIKGARWDEDNKWRAVPLASFAEVEDLARLYNFVFTASAREAIDAYQACLESSQLVKPKARKPEKKDDPLKQILKSSRGVLDDLKDE